MRRRRKRPTRRPRRRMEEPEISSAANPCKDLFPQKRQPPPRKRPPPEEPSPDWSILITWQSRSVLISNRFVAFDSWRRDEETTVEGCECERMSRCGGGGGGGGGGGWWVSAPTISEFCWKVFQGAQQQLQQLQQIFGFQSSEFWFWKTQRPPSRIHTFHFTLQTLASFAHSFLMLVLN